MSYLLLLGDEFPSTDEEQSVHLEVPYPDVHADLNRWMPLAKWFLAIPHYLVLLVLDVGVVLATIAAWFAIVVTGRYPRHLFDFIVGVMRWHNRVFGYALVLGIQMALYGFEPFRPTHPAMDAAPPLLGLTMWLALGLASLWSVCVSVVGFAEVNRFSIARSIATSLLAFLIVLVTIAAMALAVVIAVPLLMERSGAQ